MHYILFNFVFDIKKIIIDWLNSQSISSFKISKCSRCNFIWFFWSDGFTFYTFVLKFTIVSEHRPSNFILNWTCCWIVNALCWKEFLRKVNNIMRARSQLLLRYYFKVLKISIYTTDFAFCDFCKTLVVILAQHHRAKNLTNVDSISSGLREK